MCLSSSAMRLLATPGFQNLRLSLSLQSILSEVAPMTSCLAELTHRNIGIQEYRP